MNTSMAYWGQPNSSTNIDLGGFEMPNSGPEDFSYLDDIQNLKLGGDNNSMWSKNAAFGQMGENGWEMGWALPALKTFGGIASTYLGYKSLGLQEKAMKQGQKNFKSNFNTQAQLANTQMEDRQRARVASNPNAYRSVGSYMTQNKIEKI